MSLPREGTNDDNCEQTDPGRVQVVDDARMLGRYRPGPRRSEFDRR